ncbi:MAG TPA: ABC transporter ATP-binding protein [Candidatus Egerieimonas faecigallinarum]|nr:ABC transporter ATP-binding protein [Candidatus Egerieimonas faecigallinarum]
MLEVQELTKKYGKTTAADRVTFTVPPGNIGVLLGPNGAGKSTVIKSIAGLLKYTGGIGICRMPARSLEAKKVFAYVPEIPSMFPSLSVEEHLEYISRAYGLGDCREYMEELLERFEMSDKRDKLGNELSKGMMQKVSICCALLIRPKVILFDEPMVGLDPKAIKELKDVILELKEHGVTVLISTHMLEMVQELWDIVFVMEKGSIVSSCTREEANGRNLDELFFSVTEGDGE